MQDLHQPGAQSVSSASANCQSCSSVQTRSWDKWLLQGQPPYTCCAFSKFCKCLSFHISLKPLWNVHVILHGTGSFVSTRPTAGHGQILRVLCVHLYGSATSSYTTLCSASVLYSTRRVSKPSYFSLATVERCIAWATPSSGAMTTIHPQPTASAC